MASINLDVLDEVIGRYEARFDEVRPRERYKWEAVRHFQDVYDPEASDYAGMLADALQEDTKLNLLFGAKWFPVGMLKIFSWEDKDGVKAALKSLFDQSIPLRDRMVAFDAWAQTVLASYNKKQQEKGNGAALNHYQDTRAMTVYLTFMHPESNYLYKTRMYTQVAAKLGIGHPGNKFDKVIAYYDMCDQILAHLTEKHQDLIERSDASLGELTAFDPEHHLLVQDIVYFMAAYDKSDEQSIEEKDGWYPPIDDYSPGIDVDGWKQLLDNPEVFTKTALEIVYRMHDFGGSAT
ncbi:MAG: hypothetical protein IJI88_04060, partial [Atopobiaceae bacterium]|nr:hypothetical protein [Atopobiaceae bacterium]